jgi:hypothetical protein
MRHGRAWAELRQRCGVNEVSKQWLDAAIVTCMSDAEGLRDGEERKRSGGERSERKT